MYFEELRNGIIMDLELAKIDKDGLLDLRHCYNQEGAKITELRNAGYLDFVSSEMPQCESGFHVVEHINEVGGKLLQTWSVEPD